MNTKLTAFISILLLMFLSPMSLKADDEVIRRISTADLERMLKSLKLEFEEAGDNSYKINLKGISMAIFNGKDDLQLFAAFKEKEPVTLSRINEWNQSKRFARAYVAKNGTCAIEADLDIEGGVTVETVVRFIALFSEIAQEFQKHIAD
jgi:hypothetical protein